jgi:hypothetical protein
MTVPNQLSDNVISGCFEAALNTHDEDAICDQRRAISVITSKLDDFASALPRTHSITLIDMQSLCAKAQGQHESNIIGFLEENGYSAQLAYQMARIDQPEAA